MHIIIVGAGEVGRYLAQILIEERHDVTIVEQDEKVARELDDRLDAQIIRGTGISREALFRAGIRRTDLLLAVTQVDEVNLIAAMTAEKLANNCRTVARVRDPRYLYGTDAIKANEYGVDFLVGPERGVADQVVKLLEYDGPGQISQIADDKLTFLELPVMPHSTLVYATLEELRPELPERSDIVASLGNDGIRLLSGADRFQVGERIFVLCAPEDMKDFLRLTGSDGHHVEKVLLIGGGDIGYHVARALQRRKFDVTVIEKDNERCEQIAVKLRKSTIICGDGTEPSLLSDQMEEGQDAVVVLLEDDEKSLLIGIMSKHLGAKKVVTRVDKREYAPIAHKLGVDALISPRRAVADAILRFVRRGHIDSTTMLGDHQGELIDFRIDKDSKHELTEIPVKQIRLPRDAVIGAIVRDKEILVPRRGDETLRIGDHVFVVALREAVSELESVFA